MSDQPPAESTPDASSDEEGADISAPLTTSWLKGVRIRSELTLTKQLSDAISAIVGESTRAAIADMTPRIDLRISKELSASIEAINARITESTRAAIEAVVPKMELRSLISNKAQAAIDAMNARFGESVREAIDAMGGNLRRAVEELWKRTRAPNWPDDIRDPRELAALIEETGWPLVWLPRADVIREMLAVDELSDRHTVLLARQDDVIEDVLAQVAAVADPVLTRFAPKVSEAADALRAGYACASQALSAAVLSDLLVTAGFPTLSRARKKFPADWETTGITYLRLALIGGVVVDALEQFPPEDDPHYVPETFNRHASTHTVAEVQYTPINALVALMLTAAMARELEELARRGVLSTADEDDN
jgi:hypothetical protein